MLFPELSFHEFYDLKKSCKYLFPEKRFSEIDEHFLGSLNTDQLRRTYKKRIFDCHPDRLGAATDSLIRFKTKECQQINEAYGKLKQFVQDRNEWIYTILTSFECQVPYSTNGTRQAQSRQDRTDILDWLKRHFHPVMSSFKGFFREMPEESARSM